MVGLAPAERVLAASPGRFRRGGEVPSDPAKRAAVGDVAWFHEIVRKLFFHRRKYIRHVLAAAWKDRWTKAEVDQWLATQGLGGNIRAESLHVHQFLSLAVCPPRALPVGDTSGGAWDATGEPDVTSEAETDDEV